MLQKFRERLTLLLIVLLPFHAFMVTVGTRVLVGPNRAPFGVLVLWKEGLLAFVVLLAVSEVLLSLRKNTPWQKAFRFDWLDAAILCLIALAAFLAVFHGGVLTKQFFYGFKYDFVPLVAFLVLRRVGWSDTFRVRTIQFCIWSGGAVVFLGMATLLLPQHVFEWLGYSSMHSLYVPGGPLAAFQQIGGTALRRMQSVMSGPNQLGLWLLIPFSFTVVFLRVQRDTMRYTFLPLLVLFGTGIFLTFSRAALFAALFVILAALGYARLSAYPKRFIIRIGVAVFSVAFLVIIAFPSVFFRVASTRGHFLRPLQAMESIIRYPFGLGLGAAGPASNRVSDACVFLPVNGDVTWAETHPELCVFLGESQVLPPDRQCRCPFLTENWYLQIGVELGIVGFFLSIFLTVWVLLQLARTMDMPLEHGTFLAFFGVSIAALFLHAWEDSAVAYTLWVLTAASLAQAPGRVSSGGIS